MEDPPPFSRIDPICPEDDCASRLGIGQPDYADENPDIASAAVWCSNDDCGLTATAQFALVDLLTGEADTQRSLVDTGMAEPQEAQYQPWLPERRLTSTLDS